MTITDLLNLPEIFGWKLVSPPAAENPLTPREQQVMDMIAAGNTHKETAFELGVSDATVRVLYARAMKKLGRSKRPAAKKPTAQP